MMMQLFGEPKPNPRLAEALRQSEREPSAVDDHDLRASIVRAARPQLERLRRGRRSWWEWTAAWSRIAVPIALAASLVTGVLLVGGGISRGSTALLSVSDTASNVILGAAMGGVRSGQVADEFVAQASDNWLLTRVMSR